MKYMLISKEGWMIRGGRNLPPDHHYKDYNFRKRDALTERTGVWRNEQKNKKMWL